MYLPNKLVVSLTLTNYTQQFERNTKGDLVGVTNLLAE